MSFTTCSKDYIPTYVDSVFEHVQDAENVLGVYDESVQEALDSDQVNTIPQLASNATVAMTIKLERIQELPTNEDVYTLQQSAINYIQAMFDMIKAEEAYARYGEGTTLEEAREMDSHNIEARNKLEQKHKDLLEAREAVETKIEK